VRQLLRLLWRVQASNIKAIDAADFLRQLLYHLRGHVIVIWDNCSIHKGRHLKQLCRDFPRLHVEYLPSYAPQLNPDEGVWGLAKGTLANGRPDDLTALAAHLDDTLTALARSPDRLRGCITHSEPPPFLR
jgi:transposase